MAWLAAGQELLSAGFSSFKACCVVQAGFSLQIKTSKFRQQCAGELYMFSETLNSLYNQWSLKFQCVCLKTSVQYHLRQILGLHLSIQWARAPKGL